MAVIVLSKEIFHAVNYLPFYDLTVEMMCIAHMHILKIE